MYLCNLLLSNLPAAVVVQVFIGSLGLLLQAPSYNYQANLLSLGICFSFLLHFHELKSKYVFFVNLLLPLSALLTTNGSLGSTAKAAYRTSARTAFILVHCHLPISQSLVKQNVSTPSRLSPQPFYILVVQRYGSEN